VIGVFGVVGVVGGDDDEVSRFRGK
jgi:hypothetical protein